MFASMLYPDGHNKNKISIKKFSTYDEAIKHIFINDSKKNKQIKLQNNKTISKHPQEEINNFKFKTSCDTFKADAIDDNKPIIDLHTFSDGKKIKYKVSGDGKFVFIILINFSLEDIKDIRLKGKKRFLIKTKLDYKNFNKKITNKGNLKRIEVAYNTQRKYPLYIVTEIQNNHKIKKCDFLIKKKNESFFRKYIPNINYNNNYDFIYKIYLEQ